MLPAIKLVTKPVNEIISLEEAKSFMRVPDTSEDALIDAFISSARRDAEEYTQRAFITQGWEMFLDNFPFGSREPWFDGVREMPLSELQEQGRGPGVLRELRIPRPPLISVEELSTFDRGNAETTFDSSNYYIDDFGAPGRLILNDGNIWPVALRRRHAVRVQFTAGYGPNADDVPESVLHAIKVYVMDLYENRGDEAAGCGSTKSGSGQCSADMPGKVKRLLDPFRMLRIM